MDIPSTHGYTKYAVSGSEMSAEERRAGRMLDKLFLACVVPDGFDIISAYWRGKARAGRRTLLTLLNAQKYENECLLQCNGQKKKDAPITTEYSLMTVLSSA